MTQIRDRGCGHLAREGISARFMKQGSKAGSSDRRNISGGGGQYFRLTRRRHEAAAPFGLDQGKGQPFQSEGLITVQRAPGDVVKLGEVRAADLEFRSDITPVQPAAAGQLWIDLLSTYCNAGSCLGQAGIQRDRRKFQSSQQSRVLAGDEAGQDLLQRKLADKRAGG